ncbi:MAG: 3-hydroxyacyl-CoA dehydrogenase [Smithellaceae bacterium]|nr:3-hydroxyacyl-CoA dehydrogenase [Smithellaceae bacterium]
MELKDIKKVLILGAGAMGQQIGFVCAMHGYRVTYYDISDEILKVSMKRVEKLGSAYFVPMGRITVEQLREIMGRISATSDPAEAAKDADIVSESVIEDPRIKASVFAQFNKLCPERTIFTTNTSLLMPSKFAAETGRPEKFLALHFHDLRANNVVDVMPHPGTDPAVTQLVRRFAVSIGQIAIMLHRESNGYVFNAILSSICTAAMTLVTSGVASIEDVDRAWMGVMRMPLGPFGMMDQMGLKTVWHVNDYWARNPQEIPANQLQVNADFLKEYVDRGELGAVTRKGFYTYPNPAYARPDFLAEEKK